MKQGDKSASRKEGLDFVQEPPASQPPTTSAEEKRKPKRERESMATPSAGALLPCSL
jgi:hypothetical protein